ncbi:transglycosylase domain-containing protein [Tropicimonas sp. S265A]|uniref:transglycosylase domain-containing protein n=1 Tax=Tropicimonas sp. S265A TaxID=3415134 RepID=UPI003C7AF22A
MSTGNRKGPVLRADKRPAKKAAKPRASSGWLSGLFTKRTAKPKPTRRKAATPKKAAPARARKAAPKAKGKTWVGRMVRRVLGWVFGLIFAITWRVSAVVLLIVLGFTGYHYAQLPPALELTDGRVRGSVTLLDRNGDVFAWRGDQFGGIITADTVSPDLKNAIIATEDRRFYRHFGVSPRGIASAVRINLREGRGPLQGHGGSTITQQVAKLLCLGVPYDPASGMTEAEYETDCRGGGITRKLREVPFALALEAKYTKDEILTIYLNRAYLGAGARGFAAASQRYFGKSAADVDPAEAAMLAGLLVAPSRFAPTSDLERSQARAATIVRLMQDQGFLSSTEAAVAIANPATLSEAAEKRAGGYFADWVMDTAPSYLSSQTTEDVIIRSTLDQGIQTAAEDALKYIFETKVSAGSKAQAAIVVMSADGAVRAMVGGRKLQVSGAFNRATQALRQTGSAFKPFVYAAALDLGWRYDDLILDAPLTLNIPGSGPWSPRNYTNQFYGNVTLTHALKTSLNTPAVRLSEDVGRENVRKVATEFGIARDMAEGPALALGASESTLLEMTAAYAGILNGGSSVAPYGLSELRLLDDPEPILGQTGGIGERVITQGAADQLIYMMNQVVESGTGQRAKLPDGRPAAAKTGTTQAARDAWFVGFTADYVAGVWMGYDDNTPLTGVTGGGLPAEIWRETMARVHEGDPIRQLPMTLPPPRVAELQPQQQGTSGNRNVRTPESLREAADQFRRDVNEVENAIGGVLRQLFGN